MLVTLSKYGALWNSQYSSLEQRRNLNYSEVCTTESWLHLDALFDERVSYDEVDHTG